MTARQAVLASVVDSSHVALEGTSTRPKKQPLTEMEIALKREETARKRKNLSEKKAEDERNDTINRLLKKQTRPRARRANTGNVPLTGASTPQTTKGVSKTGLGLKAVANEEGEDEIDLEDEDLPAEIVVDEPKPTMYRWVSRVEDVSIPTTEGGGDTAMDVVVEGKGKAKEGERKMVITFSVPDSLLPAPPTLASLGEGVAKMDLDPQPPTSARSANPTVLPVPGKGPGVCAIQGCTAARKYRFVKDWTVGACGMGHLKDLEGQWMSRGVV
ncbi:hypothetical protein BKA70DRAFT_1285893 [Coprinopsis sp. MPI-PUGE-AT-0042]|nr:hypothetical protein BKA70DRAFT_1285893 [Coprinopsis sp. MPI-PUGE-AT-0042]